MVSIRRPGRAFWTGSIVLLSGAIASLALLSARPSAQASAVVGPNQCINCHDHESERAWSGTREQAEVLRLFPDRGKQAGHVNSKNQLEDPKAAKFTAAAGMTNGDPYDPNGVCIKCHAVDPAANDGVSCESCHGPARSYLTIHKSLADQKPHPATGYAQDVKAGMRDIVGKPEVWARQCMTCHIMTTDPKFAALIKAGHPSGKDFDLSVKYAPVALHFKSGKDKYSRAQVAEIWTRVTAGTLAVPSPAPPSPPPALVIPPPAGPTPESARGAPGPAPGGGKAPAVDKSQATTADKADDKGAESRMPDTSADNRPPPLRPSATPSPSLAAAQGQLIAALTKLLNDHASMPVRAGTTVRPIPYQGPDAALLELQSEAIALALQVLGRAPAAKGPGDPGKR